MRAGQRHRLQERDGRQGRPHRLRLARLDRVREGLQGPGAQGGWDHIYVDNVDAQWYTGHGWSGGFTFKSSVDDTEITPADARWGNRDLEWMQLESCQVLRDTNGFHDYFSRWGGAVDGLHMLNGFHTNAYCVGGGTGGTFAAYLFPRQILWWTLPALTVRNAWAQMAIDKEPSGVVYRSMGNIGSGWRHQHR